MPVSNRLGLVRALCFTMSLFALVANVNAADDGGPKEIKALGGPNAFHRPALTSPADLAAVLEDKRADIDAVLAKSGWGGNSDDLIRALTGSELKEVQLPVGTRLQWMALRRKKMPDIQQDVVWAGKAPMEAYQATFLSGDFRYTMVVPKKCTNLAMLHKMEIPPPVAQVTAAPATDCITRKIRIDASGSSIQYGSIDRVEVTMTQPSGKTMRLGPAESKGNNVWEVAYDAPGTYAFEAVAVSNTGRRSSPANASVARTPCPPSSTMSLSATELLSGEEFTVDSSGSRAQVGELRVVEVEVVNAMGEKVADMELAPPFRVTTKQDEAGTYTYRAIAVDSLGQRSTVSEATILILPRLGYFVDALAGNERRWRDSFPHDRSAPMIGAKVGPMYKLSNNVRIGGGAGFAFNTRDNDNSSLFADVELNYHGSAGLLGAGIGVWDITNSDTVTPSFLLHTGINLPWKIRREPVAFLMEGRLFLDHGSMPDNNFLLWGGLRFSIF